MHLPLLFAVGVVLATIIVLIIVNISNKKPVPAAKPVSDTTAAPAKVEEEAPKEPKQKTPPPTEETSSSESSSQSRIIAEFKVGNDKITSFAISKNVIAAVSQNDHVIKLFRTEFLVNSQKPVHRHTGSLDLKRDYASAIALSSDAKYLAVGLEMSNKLQLYRLDIAEPKNESRLILPPVKASLVWGESATEMHYKTITQIEITGKYIITCCEGEDRLYIFDLSTGQLLLRYNTGQLQLTSFCMSHSGQYLCPASFTTAARVYELSDGGEKGTQLKKHRELIGHKNSLTSISFHRDDFLLAASAKDGTFRFFNILPLKQEVQNATEEDAMLFEGKATDIDKSFTENVEAVMFSPTKDRILFVVGKHSLVICDTVVGYNKKAYKNKKEVLSYVETIHQRSEIAGVKYFENVVAVGAADGHVRIYPLAK